MAPGRRAATFTVVANDSPGRDTFPARRPSYFATPHGSVNSPGRRIIASSRESVYPSRSMTLSGELRSVRPKSLLNSPWFPLSRKPWKIVRAHGPTLPDLFPHWLGRYPAEGVRLFRPGADCVVPLWARVM